MRVASLNLSSAPPEALVESTGASVRLVAGSGPLHRRAGAGYPGGVGAGFEVRGGSSPGSRLFSEKARRTGRIRAGGTVAQLVERNSAKVEARSSSLPSAQKRRALADAAGPLVVLPSLWAPPLLPAGCRSSVPVSLRVIACVRFDDLRRKAGRRLPPAVSSRGWGGQRSRDVLVVEGRLRDGRALFGRNSGRSPGYSTSSAS